MDYIPKGAEFRPDLCKIETVRVLKGGSLRRILKIGNELFRHYRDGGTVSGTYRLEKMTRDGWSPLDRWGGDDERAGEHLEEADLKHFAKACYDY
jgi:hypothetical protein